MKICRYIAGLAFFALWGIVGSISNGNIPLGVGIAASVFAVTVGLVAALAGGMFKDEVKEEEDY